MGRPIGDNLVNADIFNLTAATTIGGGHDPDVINHRKSFL
jgi:hypothetical protein